MRLDPPFSAETKAWLTKATSDLRAAGHALTARPPLFSDSAFHCQQAAEKAWRVMSLMTLIVQFTAMRAASSRCFESFHLAQEDAMALDWQLRSS